MKRFHPEWSPRTGTVQHLVAQRDTRCVSTHSVVLPYRSIIHRLFPPPPPESLSSWGQSEGREEARERRTIFFSSFFFFFPVFFSPPLRSRTAFAVCILICSSYNSTDHGCKTSERISCDRDHGAGVVRLASRERGVVSQAGKRRKIFGGEFRGRKRAISGNGFGRKPQTAARWWKRAYESGDSHLTRETMGNDREDDEEEARFAAGLKVPRCVTRLSGAELMPPSE